MININATYDQELRNITANEASYSSNMSLFCAYCCRIPKQCVYSMVIITPDGMPNNKSERLRKSGTLNPHPEAVSDPLFEGSPFFDPRDLLQVRYEMIRSHKKDTTLEETAARFGMSVPTCVRAKRAFREGGLQALIPGRRGPRGPRKITPEILDFAQDYRATHGAVSVRKLAELIRERFDVTIHFSGLHRALSKKNSGKRS